MTDATMLVKKEHCSVIEFLTKQEKPQKVIFEEMVAVYQFKSGQVSLKRVEKAIMRVNNGQLVSLLKKI